MVHNSVLSPIILGHEVRFLTRWKREPQERNGQKLCVPVELKEKNYSVCFCIYNVRVIHFGRRLVVTIRS
jgi:hypothetical protein